MAKLLNRTYVNTATVGTGTISLGPVVQGGYQSFADAGAVDGDVVVYGIEDDGAWEVGEGTYSAGTLTRNPTASSNGGSPISLSGGAQVYGTVRAIDIETAGGGVQPTVREIAASGATTIDVFRGNWFNVTPSDNVTISFNMGPVLSYANVDFVWENVSGYTLSFADTVVWEGGSAPTLSASGLKDWLYFKTADAGATWVGSVKKQGF